jgi:hypothetical protein
LHHLADPKAGWRVLLSLLAPNGTMRVGLYRDRATADRRSTRHCRRARLSADRRRHSRPAANNHREKDEPRWKSLVQTIDFYSTSGCRDMFFNVMEHRLTIPDIKAFLNEQRLTFLGFELDPQIIEQFRQQNPTADALTDLDAREGIRGRQLADVPEHVCLLGLQKGRDGRRAEVAARDRALCGSEQQTNVATRSSVSAICFDPQRRRRASPARVLHWRRRVCRDVADAIGAFDLITAAKIESLLLDGNCWPLQSLREPCATSDRANR